MNSAQKHMRKSSTISTSCTIQPLLRKHSDMRFNFFTTIQKYSNMMPLAKKAEAKAKLLNNIIMGVYIWSPSNITRQYLLSIYNYICVRVSCVSDCLCICMCVYARISLCIQKYKTLSHTLAYKRTCTHTLTHTSYIIDHTSYIIHHTPYIIHHTSYLQQLENLSHAIPKNEQATDGCNCSYQTDRGNRTRTKLHFLFETSQMFVMFRDYICVRVSVAHAQPMNTSHTVFTRKHTHTHTHTHTQAHITTIYIRFVLMWNLTYSLRDTIAIAMRPSVTHTAITAVIIAELNPLRELSMSSDKNELRRIVGSGHRSCACA